MTDFNCRLNSARRRRYALVSLSASNPPDDGRRDGAGEECRGQRGSAQGEHENDGDRECDESHRRRPGAAFRGGERFVCRSSIAVWVVHASVEGRVESSAGISDETPVAVRQRGRR